jgi:hypothetical protein
MRLDAAPAEKSGPFGWPLRCAWLRPAAGPGKRLWKGHRLLESSSFPFLVPVAPSYLFR